MSDWIAAARVLALRALKTTSSAVRTSGIGPQLSADVGWPAIPANELPQVLLRAVDAAAHGITIAENSDDHPLIYVNAAFVRMTGYPTDEMVGRNCRFLQGPDTDPDSIAAIRAGLRDGVDIAVVLRNYRRDGTPFWNEVSICSVRDGTGRITHFVATQVDVTERVDRERELAHLAHTDPLTGLSNRAQLSTELTTLLARRDRGTGIAVIFIDLDGFHRINEDFDFETGNLVLAAVAERLDQLRSPNDLLARLDADSYVLVRSAPEDRCAAIAQRCVADIHSSLQEPVRIGAMSIPVRVNCGVAHHPADGDSAATLIRAARRAMETARSNSD
jgi:diguanylate cyclase (GGDEF)-like protein/PAS domain S-box-containing protein